MDMFTVLFVEFFSDPPSIRSFINSTNDLFAEDDAQMDIRQLRNDYRKQGIIANLNINSLRRQICRDKRMARFQPFWHFFRCTESRSIARSFPNTQFLVEGHNLIRLDRVKGGVDIVVYIQDNISSSRKKEKMEKKLEWISFDKRLALMSAYQPPSVDNTAMICEWIDIPTERSHMRLLRTLSVLVICIAT